MEAQLTPFEGQQIRSAEVNGEMYFSVIDVIGILTESTNPQSYWGQLKKREPHLLTICQKVKFKGMDGKNYPSDCANTEGVFRIIMSVPSPKADPLKQWLANLGKQAIDEAENPELLSERQAELYRAKGYPEEWVRRRMQTIETRQGLTDEWKLRNVKDHQEYAILTATIAKGTFGLNPSEHSKLKGLERQNLRDHMTPLELIFTALSEEITKRVTVQNDAQGFAESYEAAQKGGQITGGLVAKAEKDIGEKVVSSDNFLGLKGREGTLFLANE